MKCTLKERLIGLLNVLRKKLNFVTIVVANLSQIEYLYRKEKKKYVDSPAR